MGPTQLDQEFMRAYLERYGPNAGEAHYVVTIGELKWFFTAGVEAAWRPVQQPREDTNERAD